MYYKLQYEIIPSYAISKSSYAISKSSYAISKIPILLVDFSMDQ